MDLAGKPVIMSTSDKETDKSFLVRQLKHFVNVVKIVV